MIWRYGSILGEFDFRYNARGVSDAARANAALRGIEASGVSADWLTARSLSALSRAGSFARS
jgi:hypothetical protein